MTLDDLRCMRGVKFTPAKRSAKPRSRWGRWYYIIVEAVDEVTGKRRRLPDGTFVWPVCDPQNALSKKGSMALDDALAEARATALELNSIEVESLSGGRSRIKTDLSPEQVREQIVALELEAHFVDSRLLRGVSDAELLMIQELFERLAFFAKMGLPYAAPAFRKAA